MLVVFEPLNNKVLFLLSFRLLIGQRGLRPGGYIAPCWFGVLLLSLDNLQMHLGVLEVILEILGMYEDFFLKPKLQHLL